MLRRFIFLITLIVFSKSAFTQISYPDKHTPESIPLLFAKGVLTNGLSNRDFTISPKGDEIFYTIQQHRFASSTILHLIKRNGKWSKPQVASFSGKFRDLEATFSPDGQFIYFSSDRPLQGDKPKDFDIWKVKRMRNGSWGKPENLGSTVNSSKDEFYPSITRSENLYFTVEAPYGKGSEDIVMCKWLDTGYAKSECLPEDINTKFDEFNAFVDPDEKFILFSSYGRADDMGGGDIYISHKDKQGNWLPVQHLPSPINSTALDYCPYVTWDKKYLLFTSNRLSKIFKSGRIKNYSEIKRLLTSPGNGFDDIYWVRFDKNW